MKNTHDPFDKELRERLRNYSEEPENDLWPGIALNIVTVNPEPGWVNWSNRISIAVLLFTYFVALYPTEDYSEKVVPTELPSNSVDIGNTGTPPPANKFEVPGSKPGIPESAEASFSNERAHSIADPRFNDSVLRSLMPTVEPAAPFDNNLFFSMSEQAVIAERGKTASFVSNSDTTSIRTKDDAVMSLEESTNTRSQGKVNKNLKPYKPFSFYVTTMPTFGYQRIESNVRDNILIEGMKRVPAFSLDRLGIRVEAGAEVPLSKRWKAFGGLLYYQRKQTIEFREAHLDSLRIVRTDGNITFEPQFSSLNKSIEYELKNIGVQVGLTYQMRQKDRNSITEQEGVSPEINTTRKRKFSQVFGTGVEFHKALQKRRSFQSAEGFRDPSMYVFLNVYYRLQYPNVGRLRAIFQPTLNYSFYINKDLNSPFYVKPYGLGLNFGCTYHIR